MTVPSSAAERNDYIGNGSTATYAYSYRITAQTHLLVTVADEDGAETTLAIGTDYTVTGVGIKTGGNIVLVDAGQEWIDDDGYLATGWDMTVRHYVPLTQNADIRNLGVYYPEVHEDAMDYLMWAVKQQQDELDRAVKAGETVSGIDIRIPAPVDGYSLVWSGTTGQMVNSNLKGEKGDKGDTGDTGATGAPGIFSAIASQAEAEAGTENTKGMTPLRTAQAIAALKNLPVKATGAEVNTGTDDAKFVTAKALADSTIPKETAWTDYSAVSTIVGWSSFSGKSIMTKRVGKRVFVDFTIDGNSNSSSVTFTLPYTSGTLSVSSSYFMVLTVDGTTRRASYGSLSKDSSTVTIHPDVAAGVWNTSGVKSVNGQFSYEAA